MPSDDRLTPDEDPRLSDRQCRDGGVRPIGDVLAELLDQYRGRFPDSQQILPRFSLSLFGIDHAPSALFFQNSPPEWTRRT